MKRFFFFCVGSLLILNCSFSQHTLEVEITEIRNNTGNILLQFFDADEKVLAEEMSPIKENKCLFTFKNLKPGKYAVRYSHDENLNNEMETNMFGIPTEGYGFSNNPVGRFGPPPFEEWLFEIKGDRKITLKPVY